MAARELLHELHGAGFSVAAEAGRLLVRPASKLSDEQRAAVRDAKPQLLALLAADAAEVARERFEERTAIAEFDGGLSRTDAEALAAADGACLDHHFDCPVCKAAARGDSYGSRCPEGAALWQRYEAACDAQPTRRASWLKRP